MQVLLICCNVLFGQIITITIMLILLHRLPQTFCLIDLYYIDVSVINGIIIIIIIIIRVTVSDSSSHL